MGAQPDKVRPVAALCADDLLTEDELYAESFPVNQSRLCCLYFFFEDDELVYVGKSERFIGRFAEHLQNNHGKFNRVAIQPMQASELTALEEAYIRRYRPRLNLGVPPARATIPSTPQHVVPYRPDLHGQYLTARQAAAHLTQRHFYTSNWMMTAFRADGRGPRHCVGPFRPGFMECGYLQDDLDEWARGVILPHDLRPGEGFR